MKKSKKAVSPVIATVLLIAIVIVIALIIFLWFRGITKEAIVKFDKNIELVCGDVSFRASYSPGSLQIVNDGSVPIYGMKIKKIGKGKHTTNDLEGFEAGGGLNQGGAKDYSLDLDEGVKEIVIIPVLLGSTDSGEKSFVCDKEQGVEIVIE